jgi:hypothetical protein
MYAIRTWIALLSNLITINHQQLTHCQLKQYAYP